jgi:hypothetical protein
MSRFDDHAIATVGSAVANLDVVVLVTLAVFGSDEMEPPTDRDDVALVEAFRNRIDREILVRIEARGLRGTSGCAIFRTCVSVVAEWCFALGWMLVLIAQRSTPGLPLDVEGVSNRLAATTARTRRNAPTTVYSFRAVCLAHRTAPGPLARGPTRWHGVGRGLLPLLP